MQKNWIHYLFIVVVCWFAFFMNNGATYPDIMESRNFVTAREMVEFDNWLVPTMNGELRFAKPPLPTWVAAVVETFSPDNVPLQRAMAGLMATLMTFFLYFLALETSKNKLLALLSAVILATSYNVIMAGRAATWDIYCHALMMGAILYFHRGAASRGAAWGRFLAAGLFLGLSFLGKGPISFYALLLPFLVAYLWLYRPSFKGKWAPVAAMLLVFVAVGFWWPGYLYIYHREEILSIFARESSNWVNYNVRPWYYYHLFFAESGLWALFLLTGLAGWFWLRGRVVLKKEYAFAVLWTVAVLVLLSCVPEKKTRYLLPLLIPAALVTAHYLLYVYDRARAGLLTRSDKIVFRVNAFIPALIALAMPVALYVMFYATRQIGLGYLILVSCLFLVAGWSVLVGGLRYRVLKVHTGVVAMLLFVTTFLMRPVAVLFNNPDFLAIRSLRQCEAVQGMPFYYDAGETPPRIEFIYEAGRRILPRDFTADTSVLRELPVVLVSERPAAEVLPPALLSHVSLRPVEIFTDDPDAPKMGRRRKIFIRQITVLEPK